MARTIKVTPEQLENTAGAIQGLAEDYQRLYEQFYTETSAMETSWKGEDNLAYINQIAGFKDDFATMYKLMTEYADFLNKSARAYRDTQADVVNKASKLAN